MTTALAVLLSGNPSGEAVFERDCAVCHERFIPMETLAENFMKQENRLLNLKAPTVNQLAFRIKDRIGDPSGDEEFHLMEVVEYIKDYLYYPDKQKSVCLEDVIRHFDTKESMLGKVNEADLEAVAEWIYYSDMKERK
jgi:transcriptional regulator NrdR family protein